MVFLSFNIRGIGSSLKHASLECIFEMVRPDIFLVQETMCLYSKACEFFLKLFLSWECCWFDSLGNSGGLLVSWNPLKVYFISLSFVGLLHKGKLRGLDKVMWIIKFYGPYNHRKDFWDKIIYVGLLNDSALILCRDLNLTFFIVASLGSRVLGDPLDE